MAWHGVWRFSISGAFSESGLSFQSKSRIKMGGFELETGAD
jgi:hypothetical protein